jgi:CRP-like cAMP-binding protein
MTPSTVALLEVEPDLGSALSGDERELAALITVPVQTVEVGDVELGALLGRPHTFGAVVLDGMLLRRLLIGDQPALRLLGPGDMLVAPGSAGSTLLVEGGYRAAAPTALALLEEHALLAVRRFPALVVGLQARMADQQERLATQLVICQLPRVEDRLLAMMWLLAESWGRVTASGTTLPLTLTHDALGELVGAKRPTVTLALKELSERGALLRQDRGWLLLESLERGGAHVPLRHEPGLITEEVSPWRDARSAPPEERTGASLLDTVRTLQRDHERRAARHATGLQIAAESRQRSREIRARIRERRLRGPAPS